MSSVLKGRARLVCVALATAVLAGCGASERTLTPSAPSGGSSSLGPAAPTVPADKLIGRWGLGAYLRDSDRPRTEKEARSQCSNAYVIKAGANGGVIMHLADQATPQELRLKGSPSGKNYIGPPGSAGGDQDREIISFDGRVLVTRFVDKDAGTRYGNMVYIRCAPRA